MDDYVREAARLDTNYISTRSVAIVIRDRAGNTATGTSTCIQVGTHHLLATAAHILEDVNGARIELIPAGELSSSRLPFIGRSCGPQRSAPHRDGAWIELDPAVVRDNRLRFTTTEDLKLSQELDRRHPFLVHGFPGESAILMPRSVDLESTVAFTMMAEPTDLHRDLGEHEIALEYPPRDEGDRPIQVAPQAHGLSGGGVWWYPRHDETFISSPSHMRLVAINRTWHSPTSVLFATKIDWWLQLVAKDFPDAKEAIEFLFER